MKCFVSRSRAAWQPSIDALKAPSLEWHCQSLIETKPLPFLLPEHPFDWIFFSSREGVKHFFQQVPTPPIARIAAIGAATAEDICAFSTVDYVGASSDTHAIAKTFAQLVGKSLVLFPISEQSVRTVQQSLPQEQVTEVLCYRTTSVVAQLPPFQLYVFSSPSNVRSFFETNTIATGASVIAFGKRTAIQLAAYGCAKVTIPDQLNPSFLADTIKQICVR
jgi:uroporphyrinogen-III synthase